MVADHNSPGNHYSITGDNIMKITLNREFHIGSFLTGIGLSAILVIIGAVIYFK